MIKGENIFLRSLEPGDIELLYAWENDSDVWRISNTVTPYSRHVLEQYIVSSHLDIYTTKQQRFVIESYKNSDKLASEAIGCIDLFDFDPINNRVGVGILISQSAHRNKGYGSEALQLLIKYCFSTLNLNQVYCNIIVDNLPSIKLFQNNGFEICGTKKQWIRNGSGYVDELMLQLLRS